jgi:hypothetical protein
MLTLLRPERAQAFYDLARCRGELGNKKGALSALQLAAAKGFKDAARVEQESAFANLRHEPAFLNAVSAMR